MHSLFGGGTTGRVEMPVKTRSVQREPIGSISSLSLPVRPRAARHSVAREERHNAQLAAIIAASDHAIISLGTDFVVQTWNAGAQRMFGYGEAEARGRSLTELIIPDADKDESAAILAAVLNGQTVLKELLRRHKDGHLVPVEINSSPICDRSGRVIGTSVIYRDISERRRAEEARLALADSEARFRATFENAAVGISHVAPDGRFLRFNKALSRLLGWPADELISKSVWEITHPDDLAVELAQFRQLEDGRVDSYSLDKRDLRKDGSIVWIRLTRSCVRKNDGSVDYFVAAVEDISARKRAEEELADSEARFRVTFENARVGIVNAAPDGRFLRVNEAACRFVGYSADELTTTSFLDIIHPDDLAASVARLEQVRQGKIDHLDVTDKRFLHKDGTIVWGRVTGSCVRKSDGSIDYFVAVVEDITARKHAEEELRKSEERFRASVLLSPLPTLLYDDREQILALSRSWLEGSSYSGEELRRIDDWTARAYGERSGEVLEYIRRIISTEPQAQLAEMTIRTKDGRERLWTFACSALGTQSDGRRLFLCVAQDVTEQKAHEEQVHFLMHEVNHRAKNMLTLVQAVARQTAAREPEDFIGRFNERIRALAANQDLLVRNEWQGVYVEELVCAQLAHFADVGSRIAADGPKLHLNAAAAQAIGLALHELATNASKYGALSVAVGRVDVRWRLEGDTFMMSWTERNGPPVSPPERRGFGSTVVDSMAKLSVGGEVQLDYAPSGLMWRLKCPAANALEPWERESITGERRKSELTGDGRKSFGADKSKASSRSSAYQSYSTSGQCRTPA
jgi:PAS domain S-box-containing protein